MGGLVPPWVNNRDDWRAQHPSGSFLMCSPPFLLFEIRSPRLILEFGGIFWPSCISREQQMSPSTGALEGGWELLDLTFKLLDPKILVQKLVSKSLHDEIKILLY